MSLLARCAVLVLLAGLLAANGSAQTPGKVKEKELQKLLDQVNDQEVTVRVAALRRLIEIGPSILPQVKAVAAKAGKEKALALQHLLHELAIQKDIDALVLDLSSPKFKVRKQAKKKLLQLGERAVPALKRVQRQSPAVVSDLEFQFEVDKVLNKLTPNK